MKEEAQKSTKKAQLWKPGQSGNPAGRKPDTPEQKVAKKASKQIIAEYKAALIEALPLIQPALVAKAAKGDVPAIKELHDRTMDKARQATDLNISGEVKVIFDETFKD